MVWYGPFPMAHQPPNYPIFSPFQASLFWLLPLRLLFLPLHGPPTHQLPFNLSFSQLSKRCKKYSKLTINWTILWFQWTSPPPPSYYSFLQTNFPVDIVPTCQTCPCQTCLLIIQVTKHISWFSICILHEHTCKYCKSQRGITEVAKEGVSTVHCQLSIAEGKHKLGRIVHQETSYE